VTTDAGVIVLEGGRVMENAGTFNVTGSEFFARGGTIKNDAGATFDFQSASTILNEPGTNAFVNEGTLEGTVATGTANVGVAVTGAISAKTGTLELSGGGTSTGAITVASGGTLDFGGGTFTLSAGSYNASGTTEISGGTTNFTGATIARLGALDVTGGTIVVGSSGATASSLTQTLSTIGGTGKLTISGAATFYRAIQTGTGTTLLEGVTTLTNPINLQGGRVLENAGTFNVTDTSGSGIQAQGCTIKNDPGATFDFQTSSRIAYVSGTNTFVNAGTLEAPAVSGEEVDIEIAVTNTGTISATRGAVLLYRGLTNLVGSTLTGGAYSVSAAGLLELLQNDAEIVTDDAKISLIGAGSTFATYNETTNLISTVDATLRTIGASGELDLLAGRNWTTANAATVTGSGALDANGTTTVSGLTIGGTTTFSDGGALTESGGSTTLGDAAGDVAKVTIASTGTWDIEDNSGITRGASTSSAITNHGLLEETGGTGTSVITPNVTNDGTVLVSSGTLELMGAVTGKGTDTISGASTPEFGAGVSTAATLGDQDIGFTGGGTLDLLAPTSFYGEISDFASGDTVELLGSWAFSGISEAGGTTTLTLETGSTKHGFEFVGDYAQSNFSIVSGTTTKIRYA
jgi:hypothetical protein